MTYLNCDKTHLNGTASSAIIISNASKVGWHAAPMIKVTHMCPAIRPRSQLLITARLELFRLSSSNLIVCLGLSSFLENFSQNCPAISKNEHREKRIVVQLEKK